MVDLPWWWWRSSSVVLLVSGLIPAASFQWSFVHSSYRRYDRSACAVVGASTTSSRVDPVRPPLNGNMMNDGGGGDSNVVAIDATTGERKFMYMTAEQDELLRQKGESEAALMKVNTAFLEPTVVKPRNRRRSSAMATGTGSTGRATTGFGNSVRRSSSKKKEEGASSNTNGGAVTGTEDRTEATQTLEAYAQVVKRDGIVRIDNVLPDELADDLKTYLVDLRARATRAVERGEVSSPERFADVLLNQNRCDLKIPLGPDSVNRALHHLLCRSHIGPLIEHIFGASHDDNNSRQNRGSGGGQAELYELNCFMSNAGARRQLVHADNVCVEAGVLPDDEPVMLTAFVALQDIDERMGPTTWLLGTNNRAAHEQFYGDEKDHVLQSSTKVVGCLPKGACALFDPRTLHCGGANTSLERENTRALFYVSFKHPSVDYPGCPTCSGYGIVDSAFTLDELRTELSRQIERKEPSTRLAFASSFP